MGEIKEFGKYIVKKPVTDTRQFIRKPSNWYFILAVVLIIQTFYELITHNWNITEIRFSPLWFISYLFAIVIISLYKEWYAGDWKRDYRKNYKNAIRKSK